MVHVDLIDMSQAAGLLVTEDDVLHAAVKTPEVGQHLLGRRDAHQRIGLPRLVGVAFRDVAPDLEQQEVLHRVVVFGPLMVEHTVADDESRRVEHLARRFGRVEGRDAVGRIGNEGLLRLYRADRGRKGGQGDDKKFFHGVYRFLFR